MKYVNLGLSIAASIGIIFLAVVFMQLPPTKVSPPQGPLGICADVDYDTGMSLVKTVNSPVIRSNVVTCESGTFISIVPAKE